MTSKTTNEKPHACEACGGDRDRYCIIEDLAQRKKEEEHSPSGVKADEWQPLIAAWLTSPAGLNACKTKTLTTYALLDALDLPDGAASEKRVADIMRELGYVRAGVVVGNTRMLTWQPITPRFELGNIVRVTHGEHRGHVASVQAREWHVERFVYALPIAEGLNSYVWVNEEHLMLAASKGGSDKGGGAPAEAGKAPPSRKGLVVAIGLLLTWLHKNSTMLPWLSELARLLQERESLRVTLSACGLLTTYDHAAVVRSTATTLWEVSDELDRARIHEVEDLATSLFQQTAPSFLDNGGKYVAGLSVAATRRERGVPVYTPDLARSPEAAGWVIVCALLARSTMEHAAGATARGAFKEAAEFERHAHALQWLIDAAGGVPLLSDGERIDVPSSNLLGDDFARRVRLDESHLHLAVAEAWADELLEPLWQDESGQHDEVYEATRLRVLDGLVSAYAHKVPRELADGIAAGKRETARPGEMGGAA